MNARVYTGVPELLWILEITIAGHTKQKELFDAVLENDLFTAAELPAVPDEAREAPKVKRLRISNERDLDLD
ncbi:MAG TPA: hypothetical protein PLV50_09095 [Smithella sp.]|nr:hypothetical protein [Smithella sp.]HOG90682.1 hypothetical protein [Smithella sp.]HQG65992.1 hypothetical protein [Smithella sp.]HQH17338.1 hypothetical protein [Smithella sp.]